MPTPSARLRQLGITLPPVARPLAAYVPARQVGEQVWTSGQLPVVDGELVARGKLGGSVSLEDGVSAARTAALNALAAVAHVIDGIDNVDRVARVVVYVASEPGFTDQPKVANGASELMQEVFGPDRGSHVRSAVGVSVLPLDSPVEVELVVEV